VSIFAWGLLSSVARPGRGPPTLRLIEVVFRSGHDMADLDLGVQRKGNIE
jgi:hypothetical protein